MSDMIVELNETLLDCQTLSPSRRNPSPKDSRRGTVTSANSDHNPTVTLSHKFQQVHQTLGNMSPHQAPEKTKVDGFSDY